MNGSADRYVTVLLGEPCLIDGDFHQFMWKHVLKVDLTSKLQDMRGEPFIQQVGLFARRSW